jgi:hypothetical protein
VNAFILWLHGFQPQAEQALDVFFHGADPNAVYVLAFAIGAFGLLVFMLTFLGRDPTARLGFFRAFFRVIALLLFIGGGLTVLATIAGNFQQCRETKGTVTFQFPDDTEPNAKGAIVTECRVRRIGNATYGPWQPPYVVLSLAEWRTIE